MLSVETLSYLDDCLISFVWVGLSLFWHIGYLLVFYFITIQGRDWSYYDIYLSFTTLLRACFALSLLDLEFLVVIFWEENSFWASFLVRHFQLKKHNQKWLFYSWEGHELASICRKEPFKSCWNDWKP